MLTLSVVTRELLLKLPDANPQRARCRRALDWFPWRSICRSRVAAKEHHARIIQTQYNRLLNCLTSVGDITAELFQKENLTTLELEYLQSFESTPIRANAELLKILMKKSSDVYENFLICLMNSKQQDAYLLLTTKSPGKHFTNSEHHRLVREHYDWLTKNIECDTGLIARLFEMGVLTTREHECIRTKTDNFKKNEALLSIICRKSSKDFVHFQEALIETGQSAVVNELKRFPESEGKRQIESDKHRLDIQRNFCWLTETIEPNNGLIQILYQNKVITFRERESICAERDVVKTNESLLKIISQKSSADFEQFKNSLTETKQYHVIQKLKEEGSKIIAEVLEKQNTIGQIADRQHSDRPPMESIVPPKSRKHDDGPKIHDKTNVSARDHSRKGETPKFRSMFSLKSNFERLENSSQIEILLKVKSLQQQNPASQNSLQECVQGIIGGSVELLIGLKRKQEEQKPIIQGQELNKESLNSYLNAVKKALPEEEKLKHKTEDQNRKINEMYERMKRQFQQQTRRFEEEMNSIKIENGTLSGLLNKEKELKESAEHDLQEEMQTGCTLKRQLEAAEQEIEQHGHRTALLAKSLDELRDELLESRSDLDLSRVKNHDLEIEVEKYKSDITAEGNRSNQLAQSLHLFAEEFSSFSVSTNTFLSLETEHLHFAMKKITDMEMKVKYATEKSALNKKMKSSDAKRVEEELREARSELDSMKEDKHRLENAIEMYKNDLSEADERSEETQRFFTDTLSSLGKSMTDCFCLETDRLNMAANKIMDSGRKLNLIEQKLVSIRKKIVGDKIWMSSPRLVHIIKAEGEKKVSAVAAAGEELFITCFGRPEIKIYDLSPLTFRRQCAIDGLENPVDLAFCKTNKCLYILDRGREQNKIIRSTVRGEILHGWSTQTLSKCISVAFDSNIVVAGGVKNSIIEYTSKGEEVRRIMLSTEVRHAVQGHAVKLRSDYFLISLGGKVVMVDIKGDVKVSFGGEKNSEYEYLEHPCYLAIASNGNIIVIDREKSRLLVLDNNLKFNRILIPTYMDGMGHPCRLAVDESTGRLFVVAYNSADIKTVVFVFKFG